MVFNVYLKEAKKLVDEVKPRILSNHLMGSNESLRYFNRFYYSFIKQIAIEMSLLREQNDENKNVMIIGGFPGVTALALQKIGYQINYFDIPEVLNERVEDYFTENNIKTIKGNIKSEDLGIFTGKFALIEICNCIEHWNFNPIEAMKTILSLLSESGKLFIEVPNAANLFQRIFVLRGGTVYPPIDSFIEQHEGRYLGEPHWREYTMPDLVKLGEYCQGKLEHSWQYYSKRGDKAGLTLELYYFVQKVFPNLREENGVVFSKSKNAMQS